MTDTKEILEDTRFQIIASMMISGVPVTEIAEKMSLHPNTVHKITRKQSFKRHLQKLAGRSVEDASNIWKTAMQERLPQALKVLDHLLKTNNPKSLEIILKTLAIDKGPALAQQGNLTVVLPQLGSEKEVVNVSTDGGINE